MPNSKKAIYTNHFWSYIAFRFSQASQKLNQEFLLLG